MNDQPKFCPNCGHALEPGSRFCGECGQAFNQAVSPEPQAASAQTQEQPIVTETGKKKPSKTRWILLIAGLLILGLSVVFFRYGKDLLDFGPAANSARQVKTPDPAVKKPGVVSNKKTKAFFDKATLGKYVTTLRFFESGYTVTPVPERIYKNDFSIYEARFINWELNLKFPTTGERIDFTIEAVWRRPDGSIHTKEAMNTYIEPGWNNSWHVSGWGNNLPGTWLPGGYMVELYVEGKKITQAGFKIY